MKNLKFARAFAVMVLVLAGGALLLLAGCSGNQNDIKADVFAGMFSAESHLQSPADLKALISRDTGGDLKILDVRTPEEFFAGCLKGAKNIDIKAADFDAKIAGLDKNATYLVYCRTGRRSADAYQRMQKAGFTRVLELTGGITAWGEAGNEVQTKCG